MASNQASSASPVLSVEQTGAGRCSDTLPITDNNLPEITPLQDQYQEAIPTTPREIYDSELKESLVNSECIGPAPVETKLVAASEALTTTDKKQQKIGFPVAFGPYKILKLTVPLEKCVVGNVGGSLTMVMEELMGKCGISQDDPNKFMNVEKCSSVFHLKQWKVFKRKRWKGHNFGNWTDSVDMYEPLKDIGFVTNLNLSLLGDILKMCFSWLLLLLCL